MTRDDDDEGKKSDHIVSVSLKFPRFEIILKLRESGGAKRLTLFDCN